MAKQKYFSRGDIVSVCLNPTSGREIQGEFRPVLVLSAAGFNAQGLTFVAPITQGGEVSRYAGFAASLTGSGTNTQGVALVNMARMVDLENRGAKLIENAPSFVVDDAIARFQAILD